MTKGIFITFEGSEGSGKSTQVQLTKEYLDSLKLNVLLLREPGGVEISEKIRDLLLDIKNTSMSAECETLLYLASRAQLVEEVLVPALKKGMHVICDRFLDSTLTYQGYGNGVDLEFIRKIGQFVTHNVKPNLTILFDIDSKEGLSRIARSKDRIERRTIAYHNRVRQGYLKLAQIDPQRIKVISVGTRSKEDIFNEVKEHLDRVFEIKSS